MNPITVLNKSNVPTGPFTRAQVTEKLRTGEIALTDLAFVEGLGFSQWTPLREVLAKVDGTAAVIPPPPVLTAPPPVTPGYSYAATMAPPPHLVYAGFWIRFVAYVLDSLILGTVIVFMEFVVGVVFLMIGTAFGLSMKDISSANSDHANPVAVILIMVAYLIILVLIVVGAWLYFAKLESGPAQATLGKRVLGLRVTDLTGQRIGFGQASGRFFGKIVSALPMDIGFIMAAFTERKQALHDMMAGTLVVRQ